MTDENNFCEWYCRNIPTNVSVIEQYLKDNPQQNVNDRNTGNKTTALMWASFLHHVNTVVWLLNKGADVNIVSSNNETALMYATEQSEGFKNCKMSTIQTLFKHGADVGMINCDGETALMKMNTSEDNTIITWLIDNMTKSQLDHQIQTIDDYTGLKDYSELTQLINKRIAAGTTSLLLSSGILFLL